MYVKEHLSSMKALVGLCISVAIFLTFYHFLGFCPEECKHGSEYTIYGISFDWFGILFFIPLAALYVASFSYPALYLWVGLMFTLALGGEIVFIGVQKFMIGTWCPVCLGIAACVFIGSITNYYSTDYKGIKMKNILQASALCLGFIFALMGITKIDAQEAAEASIKERIVFGQANSQIEMYIFTDWLCPACRKAEPSLVEIVKKFSPSTRITFVDHIVHPETVNFIPYNLAFMVNNKENYLQLRDILTDISIKTGKPSEAEIEKAIAPLGIKLQELDYADVSAGMEYFKQLGEKFKVTGTPTVVLVNLSTKKGKKLSGNAEISVEKVGNAIKALKEQ